MFVIWKWDVNWFGIRLLNNKSSPNDDNLSRHFSEERKVGKYFVRHIAEFVELLLGLLQHSSLCKISSFSHIMESVLRCRVRAFTFLVIFFLFISFEKNSNVHFHLRFSRWTEKTRLAVQRDKERKRGREREWRLFVVTRVRTDTHTA